jgi:Resolvase, N terminal domain
MEVNSPLQGTTHFKRSNNNGRIEESACPSSVSYAEKRTITSWADTTTAHGRLMLTVLGGLAEFERELIRARTDEGRKRAQARGVRFGR